MPTYVYGVTASAVEVGCRGVDGAEVSLVAGDSLSAVVSGAHADPIEANRANLMAHADVLQEVADAATVAPMRFGTVFHDDEAVRKELLESRSEELRRVLARVEGHVELSLKAYYVQEAILAEIVGAEREVAKLRSSTRSLPGDASYYGRIRLGELVAAKLARKRSEDAAAIVKRLGSHARELDEVEELPEWMVTRASFLVARGAVDEFRAAVDELASEQDGRMTFTLVGPLPPYSFVELGVEAGATA
jgi:hypothetical protein